MQTPSRIALLVAAAALLAGCQSDRGRTPRTLDEEAEGALDPAALRQAYATPAFIVRQTRGAGSKAVQDTDLEPGVHVDDTNLLIFVEGAGDTVESFRWTGALLAESPHGFPGEPHRLLVVLLKWSETTNVAKEHLNRKGQLNGAGILSEMVEVHRLRHGERGHVGILAFSAGTNVTKLAFSGELPAGHRPYPKSLCLVENVVFAGSSLPGDEALPFGCLRGRFVNFVDPRDTHYGDRAVYAAPVGETPDILRLLKSEAVLRRPHYGASAAGFTNLPTLTSPEQFDALDGVAETKERAAVEEAFKMVNVAVPPELVPYNLFGEPAASDDLDDFVNRAQNHFILMGRGPAGSTGGPEFAQYRDLAAEFVKEQVVSAATNGRLYQMHLKTQPKGANPLKVPLPLPWAIIRPQKDEGAGPTQVEPPPAQPPPAPPPDGANPGPAPAPAAL